MAAPWQQWQQWPEWLPEPPPPAVSPRAPLPPPPPPPHDHDLVDEECKKKVVLTPRPKAKRMPEKYREAAIARYRARIADMMSARSGSSTDAEPHDSSHDDIVRVFEEIDLMVVQAAQAEAEQSYAIKEEGAQEEWQEGGQELHVEHDDVAQEESKLELKEVVEEFTYIEGEDEEWMGGGQEPHAEHDDVAHESPLELKEEAEEEEEFT